MAHSYDVEDSAFMKEHKRNLFEKREKIRKKLGLTSEEMRDLQSFINQRSY